MAPFVVRGKVLVGNSGGEFGVRGWLTALDENSGKIVWRAYSTGADADVLIGADLGHKLPRPRRHSSVTDRRREPRCGATGLFQPRLVNRINLRASRHVQHG
jgi:hypothetical protein